MSRRLRWGQAVILLAGQGFALIGHLLLFEYGKTEYGPFGPINGPKVKPATFQDMHVMIFLGFGYLMTFLKRYGYSSLGMTFLMGSLFFQVGLFCEGFVRMDNQAKASLTLDTLVAADAAVAAILISFGVVIGKLSFCQLIVMGGWEIIFYNLNRYICFDVLKILDTGGSIVIHMFGAYYGLAVSYSSYRMKDPTRRIDRLNSSYTSDMFAMLGTLVLWVYWPSFNSAGLNHDLQMRAIINTVLAISASCVVVFCCSLIVSPTSKFNMTHVQNATLAGGVAIGAVASLIIGPCFAGLIGILSGFLSMYGFESVQPRLFKKFRLHDTCGVHNLHGLPALLAAFFSAILAPSVHFNEYSYSLYELYPARVPIAGYELERLNTDYHLHLPPGSGRSPEQQMLYQFFAVPITLGISIFSGLFVGFFITIGIFGKILEHEVYEDGMIFQLPPGAEYQSPVEVCEAHREAMGSEDLWPTSPRRTGRRTNNTAESSAAPPGTTPLTTSSVPNVGLRSTNRPIGVSASHPQLSTPSGKSRQLTTTATIENTRL